jgi:ribose transport system ATP-binding protein
VLDVRNMSKTFVGQRALDGVDFDVRPAEVHALVGHNGSGKSTLVKILAGYYTPDAGSPPVRVGDQELPSGDPDAARGAGLRFIHQELGLVEQLTVLENLRLGARWQTGRFRRIHWAKERRAAREALDRVGLRAHPDVLVADLGAVQRTQVAVARALQEGAGGARILFFDEPTATLPGSEVERLFEVIRSTVEQGVGVVYISHRLEELGQIADRVTVLRDGRVVGSGPQSEFDRPRLVELIVGRSGAVRSGPVPAAAARSGEPLLRFDRVSAAEIEDMSFAVHPGEVVGMAGLVGSGVHDVPGVMFGNVALTGGTVQIAGEPVERLTPHDLAQRRVAVLPSARALRSVLALTVRENLTLPDLQPLWRGGRLRLREERAISRRLVERFGVRPQQPERLLAQLSGGNQQKVSIAKWMRTEPRVLVLEEPTQGVDVGGKAEVLELLRQAATNGLGILICSSDLEDLAGICNRVLIVRGGRIGGELSGTDLTEETIAEECYRDEFAAA